MSAAAPPNNPAPTRVTSGIAGLDTILMGGFMPGGIYIVQGAPGVGKTILTNQICFHHTAAGGRALFVTLLAENHARMTDSLRGLTFFDDSRIPDQLTYLSAYPELRENGLKSLTDMLRREIQRRRYTLLVIDGLIAAQSSAETELAFKEFVHDLQEIAFATDCTMFLTTNATRTMGPERTMVDGLIELRDELYGWRAASDLQVRKFRGGAFLRGRHAYEITDDGIVVHPRLEALFAQPSRPDPGLSGKTSIGTPQLDTMLGGGLPVASTTMVMGPTGTGKTTLGLHFLSRSSRGEPGLMFGFYETPARIQAKAEQICPPLGELLRSGAVEMLWQPPTTELIDAYAERLLQAVRQRRVRRLFIDGLNSFRKATVDPNRLGLFFSALSNELRVLGVTTIYTLEAPCIFGPAAEVPLGDASNLAENMIMLRFIELRSKLYRMLSIMKVRDSNFDSELREFHISREGLEIRESPQSAEDILLNLALDADRGNHRTKGQATTRADRRGA